MKILTAMYTLRKGGAYDRFLMMVEALLERGCEVHCLSLAPVPVNHPSYLNHIMFFPFQGKNGWMAKLAVLLFFPFYGFLMGWREKVNLFVSFGPLYAFLQAVPKWILNKPMVTFVRLDLSLKFEKGDQFHLLRLLNRVVEYVGLLFTDRIVAVNTTIREEIIETIGKCKKVEVEVLFNNIPKVKKSFSEDMIETRHRLGISRQAKMFVTAGILTPRKNIEFLLKSLSKLRGEDWFLLVIGDHSEKQTLPYVHDLKELTKKLNLESRVIFKGWVGKEELWKLFSAADLFVLPSIKEGMPNVMLEALGLDLPCIGSNIPGIHDILHYEELLFDPMDEEAIAQKIRQVLSESPFFDQIKKLCGERKKVFEFDWKEKIVQLVTKGFNLTDQRP